MLPARDAPTIREFCEQYDINSVQTVRDACQALKDEGLVASRQGLGFFVAALPLRRLGLVSLAERVHQARVDAEAGCGARSDAGDGADACPLRSRAGCDRRAYRCSARHLRHR